MRRTSRIPGSIEAHLETSLSGRMPPSSSTVRDIHRETTVCYAYMCVYAYGCTEKSVRPAKVMMRRCMRYLPESVRIAPGLSDYALDLLASLRERGELVTPATIELLDRLRPNGPIRRMARSE